MYTNTLIIVIFFSFFRSRQLAAFMGHQQQVAAALQAHQQLQAASTTSTVASSVTNSGGTTVTSSTQPPMVTSPTNNNLISTTTTTSSANNSPSSLVNHSHFVASSHTDIFEVRPKIIWTALAQQIQARRWCQPAINNIYKQKLFDLNCLLDTLSVIGWVQLNCFSIKRRSSSTISKSIKSEAKNIGKLYLQQYLTIFPNVTSS